VLLVIKNTLETVLIISGRILGRWKEKRSCHSKLYLGQHIAYFNNTVSEYVNVLFNSLAYFGQIFYIIRCYFLF